FFQAEDGIRDPLVTGVQTCALPISVAGAAGLGVVLPASAATAAVPLQLAASTIHVAVLASAGAVAGGAGGGAIIPASVAALAREIGRASCRGRGVVGGVAGERQQRQ